MATASWVLANRPAPCSFRHRFAQDETHQLGNTVHMAVFRGLLPTLRACLEPAIDGLRLLLEVLSSEMEHLSTIELQRAQWPLDIEMSEEEEESKGEADQEVLQNNLLRINENEEGDSNTFDNHNEEDKSHQNQTLPHSSVPAEDTAPGSPVFQRP